MGGEFWQHITGATGGQLTPTWCAGGGGAAYISLPPGICGGGGGGGAVYISLPPGSCGGGGRVWGVHEYWQRLQFSHAAGGDTASP